MFVKKVLSKIFGCKREEVTGGSRNCLSAIFIIYLRRILLGDRMKEDRMTGRVARTGQVRIA